MDKWDFAIYKYSNNYYNLEEWFFTGAGKVNGAVNGAMEADGGLSPYNREIHFILFVSILPGDSQ
jgi:hypothetical protein